MQFLKIESLYVLFVLILWETKVPPLHRLTPSCVRVLGSRFPYPSVEVLPMHLSHVLPWLVFIFSLALSHQAQGDKSSPLGPSILLLLPHTCQGPHDAVHQTEGSEFSNIILT